jgi:hypothetical protein
VTPAKTKPETKRKANGARESATKATAVGEDARRGAKASRKPWPRGGEWTSEDLVVECRRLLEDSLLVHFDDVEASALELLRTWDEEVQQCADVRDCAGEIKAALSRAKALVEKYPHCGLAPIVEAFAGPRETTKGELTRLAWRPERELTKPFTRVVEALDRTNFLGVVDRLATNQEFAALLFCLDDLSVTTAQLNSPMRSVLKQAADAIAKNRQKNGRPAIIAKVKKTLPPRPRGWRVHYL